MCKGGQRGSGGPSPPLPFRPPHPPPSSLIKEYKLEKKVVWKCFWEGQFFKIFLPKGRAHSFPWTLSFGPCYIKNIQNLAPPPPPFEILWPPLHVCTSFGLQMRGKQAVKTALHTQKNSTCRKGACLEEATISTRIPTKSDLVGWEKYKH